MLSAVIRSALGYPAFTVGTITGTPEVRPSRSSRTRERSSQCSNAKDFGKMFYFFYVNRVVQKGLQKILIVNEKIGYQEKGRWIRIDIYENYIGIKRILDYFLKKFLIDSEHKKNEHIRCKYNDF
jgi:hypothetical protein